MNLLDYPDLQRDAKIVMRKLSILERQVTLKDAAMSFVLRIRPYCTIDNVIDGVVLTFVDITAREAGDAAFLRMLGFAHESDVIGVKLHELIHHTHPDGTPYLRSNSPICQTSQTGEAAHRDDEAFFRPDGISFPVEYWSRPIMRRGKLDGAVCTFVDISDRLGSQSALRQSEARFRAAVEAVDGIVWTNSAVGEMSGEQPGWPAPMC